MNALRRLFPVLVLLVAATGGPAAALDIDDVLVDKPVGLGALRLDSTSGPPLDAGSLSNRWTFVAIGYASCPDVCPFTLGNLAAVEAAIARTTAPTDRPGFVFLSVDPGRDDIAMLRDYVRYFSDSFVGATGPREEIDRFIAAAGAFYKLGPKDGDDSYTVNHSALVYLVDPKARIAAKFEPPLKPKETARLFSLIRARFAAETKG